MKKNNQRGFVLVEAIVVAVFVLSLFTFLFVNVVPLVGMYERRLNYDTIDGVYNANLIRDLFISNSKCTTVAGGTLKEVNDSPKHYIKYSASAFCNNAINHGNDPTSVENEEIFAKKYCDKLLGEEYIGVKYIFITGYRTTQIKEQANTDKDNFTRAEREYIKSLDKFLEPDSDVYDGYHRLIIEYNDGSFANIEVRR